MNKKAYSRRAFLGLGASAAVAAGVGLAGCSPSEGETTQTNSAEPQNVSSGPSFLEAPAAIDESKVVETIEVEVCVVGLGLAGINALREAAEQGATALGIEKAPDLGFRSGEFGTFGSERIHKELGIEQPPTEEVVNELMRVMGNRPNARLLNHWIAESGKDMDWYIETVDYELLRADHETPSGDKEMTVLPERFPVNDNYNWREENYPCFPGMIHLLPDHGPAMQGAKAAAEALGARVLFETKGEQLIKEGDRVVGLYASNASGEYVRINASKGVVLTTGDISSDEEMLEYYCPHAMKFMRFFSSMDAQGNPVNTGDGHKMALWAGAAMEDGPLAPMTHSLGSNSIGIDPFLMVDINGHRFANEDVGAQELQNAIKRQPGGQAWQIFDASYPDQLAAMPQCFGGVTHFISEEEYDQYAHIVEHFAGGYSSPAYLRKEIEVGAILEAQTIEELAEKTGIAEDTLKATLDRYNELAHAGRDEDFSKVATRLFPVENPPYYAVNFGDSGLLVLIGGIDCDVDLHALDEEKNIIPGLYVAGNTQGGRFLVDYPVTVAGASHSMALSFGRLAGRNAAQAI